MDLVALIKMYVAHEELISTKSWKGHVGGSVGRGGAIVPFLGWRVFTVFKKNHTFNSSFPFVEFVTSLATALHHKRQTPQGHWSPVCSNKLKNPDNWYEVLFYLYAFLKPHTWSKIHPFSRRRQLPSQNRIMAEKYVSMSKPTPWILITRHCWSGCFGRWQVDVAVHAVASR